MKRLDLQRIEQLTAAAHTARSNFIFDSFKNILLMPIKLFKRLVQRKLATTATR